MSEVELRLKAMGYDLPDCPKPVAAYVPAAKIGNLVYASGQTPVQNGVTKYRGKVGAEISKEEGYEAAKICALRLLAGLKSVVGDLDCIERIVKVNGYVNSTGEFGDQPFVINGASELLLAAFGDRGHHARAAIGVATLPDNASVEVELIAAVKE